MMNMNELTASEILAKLADAESALFSIADGNLPRHPLLNREDEVKISGAAHSIRRIRLNTIRFLDERNRNQEDVDYEIMQDLTRFSSELKDTGMVNQDIMFRRAQRADNGSL